MTETNTTEKKPNSFQIFLEELQRSPLVVTILAILTGIILGGLLAVVTSLDFYAAFSISPWEGILTGMEIAWNTYASLFTGSVGDIGRISDALASGNEVTIRRAFFPFFESLVQTVPYKLGGLAVAVGFRGGLFNIGVEGQIFIGAITSVWAGFFSKACLPSCMCRSPWHSGRWAGRYGASSPVY